MQRSLVGSVMFIRDSNDVKEGDVIEAFETREIERTTLDQPPASGSSS
jgi:ribosomal protein S17